jgi:hypothetical protein
VSSMNRCTCVSERSSWRMRYNFILATFVIHAAMSVMHDLIYGSPGMDPVKGVLESDDCCVRGIGKALASMRDKPIIRCENCTKTPEEVQGSGKFMVCSSCRSKLDFTIHYCSQLVNPTIMIEFLLTFCFVGHAKKQTGGTTRRIVARRKYRRSSQAPFMICFGHILIRLSIFAMLR